MGSVLGIQTDTDQEIPNCVLSDFLRRQLLTFPSHREPLVKITEHFLINLESITGEKIVGKEEEYETLEEFMLRDPDDKDREKYWHEKQIRLKAAWQSPETIVNAILPLLKALETTSIFSDLEIEDPYFTSGRFNKDLMDIVRAMNWCSEAKIKKVRMYVV